MTPKVTATLRQALRHLETERQGIDRQIRAIRSVLGKPGDARRRTPAARSSRPTPTPRRMSAAARQAVSRRMKAYWAERRAAKPKGNAKT